VEETRKRALQQGEVQEGVLGTAYLIFQREREREMGWQGGCWDHHHHCLGRFAGQLGEPFVVVGVADGDWIQQVGCRKEKGECLLVNEELFKRKKKCCFSPRLLPRFWFSNKEPIIYVA